MICPWHRQTLADAVPAPATLLLGEEGDGRDILALAMAASFAGAEDGADIGALVGNLTAAKKSESSEKEWFLDKNAADIIALRPDRGHIPIGAVRRIIEFCALTPVALPRRAAVILCAEQMRFGGRTDTALQTSADSPSAVALLKTLEEPSADKLLILTARAKSLLPPTIVSRCRVVVAPPPSAEEAREWIRNRGANDAALAFCGGAPLAAENTNENKISEAAAHFAAGKNINIHAAARTMAGFDGWLDCLQKWTADGARAASGLPARYFPGGEKRQAALCGDPLRWLDAYTALIEKRRLASHPLSADLFIKETLHDFRGMFVD